MAKNIKPVENRRWSLYRYIKPEELPICIYLHASKTPAPTDECAFIMDNLTDAQQEEFLQVDWAKLRGCLFAKLTITGEVTDYEPPWFFGPFGFLGEDGEFLPKPIPYRGQLGFFEVPQPQEGK
jgi:hypothetical protein